jgi:tetratricopeptide (TPR) repeat protein
LRYRPATKNGQAIEQHLARFSVLYLIEGSQRLAEHFEFGPPYKRARAHIRDGKFDDAILTLERAFKGRLNLYEEAMGSYLFAIAYTKKGDWQRAAYHIRHAVIEDLKYLERSAWAPALALMVELETRDGNLVAALCAFERLRSRGSELANAESWVGRVVAKIEAALSGTEPLVFEARLVTHPLFDAPAVWRHQLLRPKFAFAAIKGEVKSFRLACFGTSHEAQVALDTVWNVPDDAGPCILRVEGAPDATFALIEEW